MLWGIHRNWKQPIYFHYVQGGVKNMQLVKTLREVILKVFESGFVVMGTICDQGTNNVSAINYLVKETQRNYCAKDLSFMITSLKWTNTRLCPCMIPHT